SAHVAEGLRPFFALDTETPRPDPIPSPVLVSVAVLEKLHKDGALGAFLDLFPGTRIGEIAWRSLLGRQAGAVEDRRAAEPAGGEAGGAAELAERVHAWIDDAMHGGLVHIVPDPDPRDLPALLEPDSHVARKLVDEPLRWAASYADMLAADPSWWRLTADFFG